MIIRLDLTEREARIVRASLEHTARYAEYIRHNENLNVIQDMAYHDAHLEALAVIGKLPDNLPDPVAPFLAGQLGGIAPRPVHDLACRPIDEAAAEEQAIRLRNLNQFLE